MAEQYIYAVARIRSRELSLLNEAVISQLSAAATEEDCLRILNEKNWGNPDLPSEEMFQEENKKTWALIRELVPNNMQIFDVFRLECPQGFKVCHTGASFRQARTACHGMRGNEYAETADTKTRTLHST